MSTNTGDRLGSGRTARSGDGATAPLVLSQFSTRLPPNLLERLRVAAPQLGMLQSDITATALDHFLRGRGFCWVRGVP
jgi:hypothetical protein